MSHTLVGSWGVEKAIPAGINPLHALTLKSQSLLSYACDCVLVTIITLLDTQDNFSDLPSSHSCCTELKPSVSIFIVNIGGLSLVGVLIHHLFATRFWVLSAHYIHTLGSCQSVDGVPIWLEKVRWENEGVKTRFFIFDSHFLSRKWLKTLKLGIFGICCAWIFRKWFWK